MTRDKRIGIWSTGGGPTGSRAILGMLKYLEEIGIWPNHVKVLGGTSIGAYVLTMASTGQPVEKLIDMGFQCTPDVSSTPNLKTKLGPFDIDVALNLIKDVVFNGKEVKMNETPIPMVMAATNWETLETLHLDGNMTFLEGLRAAIANPLYFDWEKTSKGILGDCVSGVNVSYLKDKYNVSYTILFDVQSQHTWEPKKPIDESLSKKAKLPIELAILITKIPRIGQALAKRYFPAKVSAIEHLFYEIELLNRGSAGLLTKIIDLEIDLQKPDAVIKLEDVTTIHPLGNSAYDRKVGLEQIEFGYLAGKLQERKLKAILSD